ncbi:MAG TPA: glycosyltransferase family A protein [Candidatus Angelobacter sp.]|nr:glycosyltransferase family A protein [Candidatus Angelobacter sp.]
MNSKDDVTAIIIALTDGERPFLAECVESTVSDPGVARTIVRVSDNLAWVDEVLAPFANDPRVHILRLPIENPGTARNDAVKLATTEWVAFLDGDDVWCRGKTAAQRDFADKNNAVFVGADHYLTDEKGRIRAVALAKYLPMTSSWLVRTDVMRQYPFRDELLEDHHWWFDTKQTVPKHRCPELLLRYRVRGLSISTLEPSKRRKLTVVTLGKKPVIGLGVFALTWGIWLVNRSKSYRPLLK